ncbi:hypothetical protein EPN15_01500 [Patescibacteria group bacterium]|nr:MAG: hypothetical protein EPN15_01500 [Patescibacteria group bacterium]
MEIKVCIDPKTLLDLRNFLGTESNLYYWKRGSSINGDIRHIITIKECGSNVFSSGVDIKFDVVLDVPEQYTKDGHHDSPTERKLIDKLFNILGVFPE